MDVWTAHFEQFKNGNGCGCIRAGRNGWTFGDEPEFVASVDRIEPDKVELKAAKGTVGMSMRTALYNVFGPVGIVGWWSSEFNKETGRLEPQWFPVRWRQQ
jgi:hypothetical protein